MRNLKVLFIAPNMKVGGAERQWSTLFRNLPSHQITPSLLTLDSTGPFYEELNDAGFETHCAHWSNRRQTRSLKGWQAWNLADVDLIVARGLSAHFVALRLSRKLEKPFVVTEHTHYDLLPPARHRRLLLRRIAPRSPHVIGVSQSQIESLSKYGYRQESITVIPNGAPPPTNCSPNEREALRVRLGVADTFCLVLVAALRTEKRINNFIEMVRCARSNGTQVKGIVVGDGPLRDQLVKSARLAGDDVKFVGEVTDVNTYWAVADAACLTSEHEVLSMSLLEAMSHGLPLIATDVGASSSLCVDGQTGYLRQVGDVRGMAEAAVRLANDPALKFAMGATSKELFETQYTLETMGRHYAEYFRGIASQ